MDVLGPTAVTPPVADDAVFCCALWASCADTCFAKRVFAPFDVCSGSGSDRFLYDPPAVTRVLGGLCDADVACQLQVTFWGETMRAVG